MKLGKKSFKKMFPNLAEEVLANKSKVEVNSVRTDHEEEEKAATSNSLDCYIPGVIDFIRRCDTEEQAEEIITYMNKRGEINEKYAQKLRRQLKEQGLRSFGTKKEKDYYLKRAKQ